MITSAPPPTMPVDRPAPDAVEEQPELTPTDFPLLLWLQAGQLVAGPAPPPAGPAPPSAGPTPAPAGAPSPPAESVSAGRVIAETPTPGPPIRVAAHGAAWPAAGADGLGAPTRGRVAGPPGAPLEAAEDAIALTPPSSGPWRVSVGEAPARFAPDPGAAGEPRSAASAPPAAPLTGVPSPPAVPVAAARAVANGVVAPPSSLPPPAEPEDARRAQAGATPPLAWPSASGLPDTRAVGDVAAAPVVAGPPSARGAGGAVTAPSAAARPARVAVPATTAAPPPAERAEESAAPPPPPIPPLASTSSAAEVIAPSASRTTPFVAVAADPERVGSAPSLAPPAERVERVVPPPPPSPSAGGEARLSATVTAPVSSATPATSHADPRRTGATAPELASRPEAPRLALDDLTVSADRPAGPSDANGDARLPGGALRREATREASPTVSDPRLVEAAAEDGRGLIAAVERRGAPGLPAADQAGPQDPDDTRVDAIDRRRPDAQPDASAPAVVGVHTRAPSAAEPEPRPEAPPPRPIVEQVAARVATIEREGRQEMSFRLDPPELGRVRVEAVLEGRHLALHIRAEEERSRDILQQDLPRLREALAQQGFTADHVSIDLDMGAAGRHPAAGGFTAFERPERLQPPISMRLPAAASLRPVPVEGVDIWV
jgi:hypothetical protein